MTSQWQVHEDLPACACTTLSSTPLALSLHSCPRAISPSLTSPSPLPPPPLQVFNCFGQYFCLHFEAFQLGPASASSPVYMAFLRFMGDEPTAKRFGYSLEVGGAGRKMTWQGVPRSIRDSHRAVRDSFDGLLIQRSVALLFSGGDGSELKLRVTGRIWQE